MGDFRVEALRIIWIFGPFRTLELRQSGSDLRLPRTVTDLEPGDLWRHYRSSTVEGSGCTSIVLGDRKP